MAHLARAGDLSAQSVREAVIWGSTMASYSVQGFSYDTLRGLSAEDIGARYQRFVDLTRF
ncbi:hypothetical protein [Pseudenhygromyxa sp. WMMC2535]|uniref:hypothetical protein n=1 Tax=Pseudenhygromyxa sp. WMMC2535 TaxID=2712867 RepID=UPI0020D070AC|nr:hypothetical protein [Pseudenhygromyxa sp. WMMC2535]